MKKNIYQIFFFVVFLSSCVSQPVLPNTEISYPNEISATLPNTPSLTPWDTPSPTPTSTPIPTTLDGFVQHMPGLSTPLPFVTGNREKVYCQFPHAFLSYSEAAGLSDEDIVRKLVEKSLIYFYSSQAPDWCRIGGYKVGKVQPMDNIGPYSPKGDLMFSARFSIHLIQVPSYWAPWGGEQDIENWFHTGREFAIFREEEGFRMQITNL